MVKESWENHLTIIIINFNTWDYLDGCLESITAQNLEPSLHVKIVVVDNASTIDLGSIVLKYPQVEFIRNNHNIGFSAANNLVLRNLNSKYVLLLNPDTLLSKDSLMKCISFLELHPKIGMLGPKLIRKDGTLDHASRRNFPTHLDIIFRMFWLDRIFPGSRFFAHYSMTYDESLKSGEVDCISGAFMLVRRLAIEEVGLLDERFFMYAEDVDWAYRFKQAGWLVYFYADVEVIHYKRVSVIQNAPNMINEFYKSNYQYYLKHYAPVTHPFANWIVGQLFSIRKLISLVGWKFTHRWI